MVEFTGERVIPGEVDPDLWNEHIARYRFAGRLAAGRRVLDAGCGSGYGAAELAAQARNVMGIDVSAEAVRFAGAHFRRDNLWFVQASCAALPVADASIDLVAAFEVIEHLEPWREFLAEVRRVLAPGGELVISTPNKAYYAETRKQTGPNPFHVHEFEFEEFEAELRRTFTHVDLFLQNHVEAISFQPPARDNGALEIACAPGNEPGNGRQAHFFVAVCSLEEPRQAPPFLYVPKIGNVLRERERHIDMLEGFVAELRAEKQNLVEMFREQNEQLERSNRWADELDDDLRAARARIVQLQDELAGVTAGYEAKIAGLHDELKVRAEWAERQAGELTECARLLDIAENTVRERTEWALRLQSQAEQLQAALRASLWIKVGRATGLGPRLDNS